jgi:hypothetical protein
VLPALVVGNLVGYAGHDLYEGHFFDDTRRYRCFVNSLCHVGLNTAVIRPKIQ